jgi:hypothetical protein
MRRRQNKKHHVCDRCGGRFGLVTHRWWGRKFCKRTCKDAWRRAAMLDRHAIAGLLGLVHLHPQPKPVAVPVMRSTRGYR